eukprot:Skav232836  [mRNA]  locus=scaffold2600:413137:414780:+ [translate_table: standard]
MLLIFLVSTLCIPGANAVDNTSEASCLIQGKFHGSASHETMALTVREEDSFDRWIQKWKEQIPLNLGKELTALMVKTALGGLFGDLVGAFIKALWPPGFQKEQRMMEIIIQWTMDYVDVQFAKSLRETVKALLDTSTRDILEEYQKCIGQVKEKAEQAWFFPKKDLQECLGKLDNARYGAILARNTVVGSSWRGGNIPIYLAAASCVATMWREYYSAMVFYETWTPWVSATEDAKGDGDSDDPLTFTYTSEEIVKKMETDYKKVSHDLDEIVKDWWVWRLDKIETKWKTNFHAIQDKHWSWVELTDRQQGRTHIYESSKSDRSAWIDKYQHEMIERVHVMYNSTLFVLELIPMLKPFTILHRLIPGREKDSVQQGGSLPKVVSLGPLSQWFMESAKLFKANRDRQTIADHLVGGTSSVGKIGGRAGAILDQLVLYQWGGTTVELPPGASGGEEIALAPLPAFTCGMEVTYWKDRMVEIALFNIKNQSRILHGYDTTKQNPYARITMGPSLCSLYTLHQFSPVRSDVTSTGDAFEVTWKWEPKEADEF